MDARRYANMTGKTVRGTVKIWDSSLAGIAILWAKGQSPALLDRFLDVIYPPFWRRELDIEDASQRNWPFSMSASETPMYRRIDRKDRR